MDLQNFYAEQLIGTDEMMKLQTAPQADIKKILTSLVAQGILNGANVQPTPPPSLGVIIRAGNICSDVGAFVNIPADVTMDLSAVGVVGVAGKEVWITLVAQAGTVNDTPVSTPGGVVQYRTADILTFTAVVGAQANIGAAVKPVIAQGAGIILADIHRVNAQASFQLTDIDLTRAQSFVNIPAILSLIANHISDIAHVTGLQAALDNKSVLGHGHTIGDVAGLQAALDAKLSTTMIDAQVGLAPVVMDGTNKVIFSTLIHGGTIKPGKGLKITLRFSRPVGHNAITYNLLANGNGLIAFPPYAPVAGVQGNLSVDAWNHYWQNFPAVSNAQLLLSDALINAAPPVGSGAPVVPTSGAGGTNVDWTVDQTISWVANGPGPDQVSPALWLVEHAR